MLEKVFEHPVILRLERFCVGCRRRRCEGDRLTAQRNRIDQCVTSFQQRHLFETIPHDQRIDLMSVRDSTQIDFAVKISDQYDDRLLSCGRVEIVTEGFVIGTFSERIDHQRGADTLFDHPAAFGGFESRLACLAEKERRQTIPVSKRRKTEHRKQFRHHLLLQTHCSETDSPADHHRDDDVQFAFFVEDVELHFSCFCRRLPVDLSHVIAVGVLFDLGKIDTIPFEGGQIVAQITGKDLLLRAQENLFDLCFDHLSPRYGALTASSTLRMISSALIPLASAL